MKTSIGNEKTDVTLPLVFTW